MMQLALRFLSRLWTFTHHDISSVACDHTHDLCEEEWQRASRCVSKARSDTTESHTALCSSSQHDDVLTIDIRFECDRHPLLLLRGEWREDEHSTRRSTKRDATETWCQTIGETNSSLFTLF